LTAPRAVVDTDVVSYLFKSRLAFQYLPDLTDRTPIVSFMTVAGLDRWVLEPLGANLDAAIARIPGAFRLFPYDRDLCTKWAGVTVAAQATGVSTVPTCGSPPQRCSTRAVDHS
jgi:hypothetical protein